VRIAIGRSRFFRSFLSRKKNIKKLQHKAAPNFVSFASRQKKVQNIFKKNIHAIPSAHQTLNKRKKTIRSSA